MRTFIAVPIPTEARRVLGTMQDALRSLGVDVRWTDVSNIHLTLKFLGEIDPEILLRLIEETGKAAATHESFVVRLHGLGSFPGPRAPRVLWCGIEGEQLTLLQASIAMACLKLGPADQRTFHPHLTLGRVRTKRNLHSLSDYIRIGSDLECRIEVRKVNIYQSTFTPRGPRYKALAQIALGGPKI